MIYNGKEDYKLKFYQNSSTGKRPIDEYLFRISEKEKAKISKYLEFLRLQNGQLPVPLVKHIKEKIWELRVDFSRRRHRLLYCILDKRIIILHIFLKKTPKTPIKEVLTAKNIIGMYMSINKSMNNKKLKPTDFQEYLKEQLKDPEFKKYYEEEERKLEIAYQVLQLRKRKRMSQAALARKIGTKQSNIARIESGQQNLTIEMLEKIARALDRNLKVSFSK